MQSVHVDRRLRVKSDARNPPSPRLRGTTRAPPSASLSTSRSADASRPRTNWTARQTLSFRNQWDDSSSAFGVALVLPLRRSLAAVETRSRLRRSLGPAEGSRLRGKSRVPPSASLSPSTLRRVSLLLSGLWTPSQAILLDLSNTPSQTPSKSDHAFRSYCTFNTNTHAPLPSARTPTTAVRHSSAF